LLIFLILLIPVNLFALQTGIENALDGGARNIGENIDTRIAPSIAAYKYYDATNGYGISTTNTVIDVYSALGRFCSGGTFVNDSAIVIPIQLSVDGSTYGDTMNIRVASGVDLGQCPIFKKIKLTPAATANFLLLVK